MPAWLFAVQLAGLDTCGSRLLTLIALLRREPSPSNRRAVLAAVVAVEATDCSEASIDGRWSLLFSTQESPTAIPSAPGPAQAIIDSTYALFFKMAPFLAGAQADGATSAARNEQTVSLARGRVLNTVRIPVPALGSTSAIVLDVHGSVARTSDPNSVTVCFERCDVAWAGGGGRITVPLPRPVGSLRTTYCDDSLRVSRGGRGGVFVLKRLPTTQPPP